jgi:hypothetical protein
MSDLEWCDPCGHYERLCGKCHEHEEDNECLESNCI